MSKVAIQKAIARLKSEIDALDGSQTVVKKKVTGLIRDLERQLENENGADHGPMIESLGDAIEQFGAEHPAIAGILNGIMTSLSNMGI